MYFNTNRKFLDVGIGIAAMSCLALLSIWPKSGEAAVLPTLPATFDTTYSPPSGNTIAVNAGGNLQTALNAAALGDTIVLQAGATFQGPFTLPNKTVGSGWIYVRSSAYANLPPPGSRISPLNAANMPKIVVAAGAAAIQTVSQSHHFRFVGIEFKPVAGNFIFSLIAIGSGETVLANLPHDIVFDRCFIHGDTANPSRRGRRGIAMNGNSIAVIDSYISDFVEAGADTQALFASNGNGPFKIVNNYLEAASENIMFGGSDPKVPNLVPSDIEIRHNHIFKPLSWIGAGYGVKNLLEFKNAQRILVEGNVFENAFPDAQSGYALLITPRNQDGTAPWSVTQDITIRLNKFINVAMGINISGRDVNPGFTTQITRRVLIENNVINVTGLNGAPGWIFGMGGGPTDVTVRHNTAFTISTGNSALAFQTNSPPADQYVFQDNLVSNGVLGFIGDGKGNANSALAAYFTNYTFTKNAIISGVSTSYPAGNFVPANTTAVGFVDFAGGNYTLAPGSAFRNAATDGKDIGADIAAVVAAGAGGLTTGLPAPTNASAQ